MEEFSDRILHVLVSQTIDDGIEEWGKDSKYQCNRCVQDLGVGGTESQVHKGHTAKENQEHSKMACTGRKGLCRPSAEGILKITVTVLI